MVHPTARGEARRIPPLTVLVTIAAVAGWSLWLWGPRSLLVAFPPLGLVLLARWGWRDFSRLLGRPHSANLHRDPLTGLPNRALLYDALCQELAECRQNGGRLAVLFLDLDRFKKVNDSYGHEIGDELLVAVAGRLSEVVRNGDLLARVGGDEFVAVCGPVTTVKDAESIADRLALALGAPLFLSGDRPFSATASIGVALADGRSTPEGVLREADAAMYRAKAAGRNGRVTFDPAMRADFQQKLAMEGRLRQALERHEFRLHYQPVIALASEEIVGFEALLRWNSDVGRVSPVEFVPLLEETGLIVPVGSWVLEEACRQARKWDAYGRRALTMAVNVSAHQLAQSDFVEVVTGVLARTGICPTRLCLEITEATLMDDVVAVWSSLRRLKGLGVKLAIDDFGTGYSSLSYLKSFSLDVLKVDQSFVRGLRESPEDAAIVQAVITLAQALGLAAVAEGVETPDQLATLKALGCDFAQGYYFTRPEPPEEIERLLIRQRADSSAPASI
jgi:diguanylate cyclase (GGDEF)-like protein